VTAQDLRTLLRNCEWQVLESPNSQVVRLCELFEANATSTPTIDEGGEDFQ
jgi:hypothetical protein